MLEKGHCIFLKEYRYIVLKTDGDKVFLAHISDPHGINGRWVLKSLLPKPFTKIKLKRREKHDK